MRKIYLLRDIKLRPFYLGMGHFSPLLRMLSMGSDLKQKLNSIFMSLQSLFLPCVKSPDFIETVQKAINQEITSLLFYDTSWYKETSWIGVFATPQKKYFAKIYKHTEDILFKLHQFKFIKEHFTGFFIIPSQLIAKDNVLISQAIDHKRKVGLQDCIEDKLVHMTGIFTTEKSLNKPLSDIIPIDFYALCYNGGKADIISRLDQWQKNNTVLVPLIPIHGDMTPWNMFVSREEKLVLVDYERAGWHVPFYDVFHFIFQPAAFQVMCPSLKKLLHKKPWFEGISLRRFLVLYLVDQLYLDLTDYYSHAYKHRLLLRAIDRKVEWLYEVLDHAQN